jgi:hypothetical protein
VADIRMVTQMSSPPQPISTWHRAWPDLPAGAAIVDASLGPVGNAQVAFVEAADHKLALGIGSRDELSCKAVRPYRLFVRDVAEDSARVIFCDLVRPMVRALPGGGVLIVSPLCLRSKAGAAERNVVVFNGLEGQPRRFTIGDGVDDVQVTAEGQLWVAYSDAGVVGAYGRSGWGRISPETWIAPVGAAGLALFDLEGRRVHEYAPIDKVRPISDCFALNVVNDGTAWFSYHPGFPLVSLQPNGFTVAWQTGLALVEAVAVHGERVLLASAASCGRRQLHLGRLATGYLRDLASVQVDSNVLRPDCALFARGAVLYSYGPGGWDGVELRGLEERMT